jgi:hypothetical protein
MALVTGSPLLASVTMPVMLPKLATSSSLHPHINIIDITDNKNLTHFIEVFVF